MSRQRPQFEQVQVGQELPLVRYPVRRVDLIRYAGASGDFNDIHWSESVATAVGLPGVIAHGMYTMATAGRFVSDWAGDPGAVLEYGVRFTNLVPVPDDGVGTTVEVSGTVAATDEQARTVTVDLTARHGENKVLGKARAVVRLP